jgi:hypothetical protein
LLARITGGFGMFAATVVIAVVTAAAGEPPDCDCYSQLGGPAGACGSVRDFVTNAPIIGAQVSFGTGSPGPTDERGCYDVRGPFSGPCGAIDCGYDVFVSAPGYESYSVHGYQNYFPVGFDFRLARLAALACSGDCDDDRVVTVNELVCSVEEALRPGRGCDCADADEDGLVRIDEIMTGIGNALRGCADCPTAASGHCATAF